MMDTRFSTLHKPKEFFSNIIKGLTLLSIVFLATGAALQFHQTSALAYPPVLVDDFNGPLLEDDWYWTNENPDKWGFNGFLGITAADEGTGSENLLLRPVSDSDFVIETHLIFEPNTNFQFAGLVIFDDEENFLQFGRAFCDIEGPCIGNGIYFDYAESSGTFNDNFATPVDSASEAYLRLERRGDMVKGFFSHDGITWFEIGTHWIPSGFEVNGVGLTASQDIYTPDWDIPANFDYFELSEGGGFLPEGFHDYDEGEFPSWACNLSVGGWAADPDDLQADLAIEVFVNGEPFDGWLNAGDYREDLDEAGVCVDGNCAFHSSLDIPSLYEPYSVAVYAQDIPSGEWVQLSSSPKTIVCRSYDIYTYNPLTRETRQITNLPDMHEFNPRWSPDGKKIVHDAWNLDFNSHGIYITNVQTMKSKELVGGERGSYPTWSPNGRWIAFDRGADEDYRLFIVPSTGGTPTLVKENAFMASWSPDSRRLVYHQPSDGSLRTVGINGGKSTLVVRHGNAPAWSPNGQWIAYQDGGDIWKVRVNLKGSPLGEPIQLTNSVAWEDRPSWSQDSKTIVYHAGMGDDIDLWNIPASGGMATWLTGAPNFGDYDPNVSNNGRFVSYASFSPNGQAPRLWAAAYSYDPPPGTFDPGFHPYHFEFEWNVPEDGFWDGQGGEFEVYPDAPDYPGYVLLRGPFALRGFESIEGLMCEEINEINYNQPTRFLVGWLPEYGEITYPEAQAHFASINAQVIWNGSSANLMQHEILPFRWESWFDYVCGFTEAPPRMDLRVNYGDDWVESFYETGHEVLITVTEADGETVKATATVWTEPKEFWNDETGFQTNSEDWFPAPPDIQPYDWVYAQVDNGVTAQVQIGEITGRIDLETDSVVGKVNAPWFPGDAEVALECHPWGSPEPVEMRYDVVFPDANDTYFCTWETNDGSEWDIQPGQVVGVGYFGPDGHWVANVIPNPWIMAFPEADQVFGYGWPEGSDVTLKINGNEIMTVKVQGAPWDENDIMAFFDFSGEPDLAAGDEVMLIGSGMDRTHSVQNLGVTEINLQEDRVSGTADEGAWVHVWVHEFGYDVWLEAVEGYWDAFFGSDEFHLQPGMCGRAEIMGDGRNSTDVDWCIPDPYPYIEAFAWFDQYSLVDWPVGIPVTVTVENTGYEITFTPDGSTNWYYFYTDGVVDLQPGSIITATNGLITKVLEISSLSAVVDAPSGIVTGMATPEATFYMRTDGDHFVNAIESDIMVDSGGNWEADISEVAPLVWFTRGEMWESDGDGDVTYAIWHVRNQLVEVWLAQNEIRALDWPVDTLLTFSVYDPGSEVTYEFNMPTQRLNWMESTWAVIGGGDLKFTPGMIVTVTGSGFEASTEIQDIMITEVNTETDQVFGTAPAYANLELRSWEDNPVFRFFTADSNGDWYIDYTIPSINGVTVDINPGDNFTLFMRDEDKNATVWDIRVPWFVVQAYTEWQNSGIYLSEGSTITIEAEGEVRTVTDGDSSGPDGQPVNCPNEGNTYPCALNDSPYGALVGKIGEEGEPFWIGSYLTFTVTESGELYLAVNDNLGYYDDNQGEYRIYIFQ